MNKIGKDVMKNIDLRVNVSAEFDWLHPPEDTSDKAIRAQSNAKLAALAHRLEGKVKEMIWDEIKNGPYT